MQMTPRGGGPASVGEMQKQCDGCGRHIEDVCSLANAYSKSVLDVFAIQTRMQAPCRPSRSLLFFTSVAKVADGRRR